MYRAARVDRIAAVVAALLATVAFVGAAGALPEVQHEYVVVEAWRVVGLATWAAIFGLLVVRPGLVSLWAIAFVSKLALVITGVALATAPAATDLVLWDGLLAAILGTGFIAALRRQSRTTPSSAQVP